MLKYNRKHGLCVGTQLGFLPRQSGFDSPHSSLMLKIYHITSTWHPPASWFVLAHDSVSAVDTVIAMSYVSQKEAKCLYIADVHAIVDTTVCQIVGIHDEG